MTRAWARALLVLFGGFWWALPTPARALDSALEARARVLFEQGLRESREGHFEAAVASFQQASELVERASVLQNLAVALAELGRNDEGLVVVERALSLEPSDSARHDSLLLLRERMERGLSARAAAAPAASIEMAPGTSVAASSSTVESPAVTQQPPRSAPAPKRRQLRPTSADHLPWALASAGAGAALASAATALYVLSGRESERYVRRCSDGSCSDAEFESARTGVRRLERSAYGLWGMSGAAAAAACTLLVLDRKARRGFDRLVVSPHHIQVRIRF